MSAACVAVKALAKSLVIEGNVSTNVVSVEVQASLKASVTATATCLTHVACVEEQVSSVAPTKAQATTTTSLVQMTVLVCMPPRSKWT